MPKTSRVILPLAVALASPAFWSPIGAAGEPTKPEGVLRLQLPADIPAPQKAAADRVYQAAEKQARYLLSKVHAWDADAAMRLLTDSRSDENHIRPNTGAVTGFAFLYQFGPYDERVVGVSREKLLGETIVPMMRYLVATHCTGTRPTGDGKPWGDAWQSAHWAQMLGRAAWWTWGDLPEDVREGVRRVVAHEADRFTRIEPPHQIQNDTKAEENAWNAQVFSAAMLILPNDPRRDAWAAGFQKWAMSSFLRPADAACEKRVDGRSVRDQFTGANVYDDFTLENHGFVHPDYMSCTGLSMNCALDYRMTGRQPPEALSYNAAEIYENLKWFSLPDGGFVYPNGQDWGLFRNPGWLGIHNLMAVYGRDPDAWSLAMRSLDCLEKMQARSESGQVFLDSEYFFASTQTDQLYSLACTWLWLQFGAEVVDRPTQRLGVRRLDSGKVILNRTKTAVHTFAWGARCMAQCVPYRLDRIVSPDVRNGIGAIRVKEGAAPLPVSLQEVDVTNGPDWFEARLVLEHGKGQVRARLRYRSDADGTFTIEEKLEAMADVTTTEIATGQIGVLNNPQWIYERGRRLLDFGDGKPVEVVAGSGTQLRREGVRQLTIDSVLEIRSEEPLDIFYSGVAKPARGRYTDMLYLNYLSGKRTWKPGEEISRYRVHVRAQP